MSVVRVVECSEEVPQAHAGSISNLPYDVMLSILKRLPLQEAVRTSVLSRLWRNQWVGLDVLLLNEAFFSSVLRGQRSGSPDDLLAYSNIVNNTLLRSVGPICKFELYIPWWFPEGADISHWVQFVLCHGDVKEFTLNQQHGGYILKRKVPSCLFSSVGLTHLTLVNFSVRSLPKAFWGFPCLVYLQLHIEEFQPGHKEVMKVETFVNSCPQLESLDLMLNEATSMTIQAPKLQHLTVSGLLTKVCLGGKTMMKTASLLSPWQRKTDFKDFLNCVPDVEKLSIAGDFWKTNWILEVGTFQDLAVFQRLKTLELSSVPFHGYSAVSLVVGLVTRCLQLQKLNIYVHKSKEIAFTIDRENSILWRLKHVEFVSVEGSKGALELIKFLLDCSPLLAVMTVEFLEDGGGLQQKLDIAKKLMQFRRASAQAELIFRT